MLALIIVGLALTMIQTSMERFTASARLRDQTLAHWIAMNQITELRLASEWPDVGELDGTVDFADLEWTWEAVVTETEVPELRRIDLQVYFPEAEISIASASGFIGESRPAESPPPPWGFSTNAGSDDEVE